LSEPKIKAGAIWTNGVDTYEWLVDMYPAMAVKSSHVLYNGEHPVVATPIPPWVIEKLKVL